MVSDLSFMSREDWDALITEDEDNNFVGLPACCHMVKDLRALIVYIKRNGLNYMVSGRFMTMVTQVMKYHYLEYSVPFMKLATYVKEWKEIFDMDVDEFAWY